MDGQVSAIDVTETNFESQVIEASQSKLVLVDFWAEWCGPCRMLSPILEQVAQAHAGVLIVAKVDADAEPELTSRYGVRGLPTVKLFKAGEVVDEFVGARPISAVEEFLSAYLPDPVADQLAEVDALWTRGEHEQAAVSLEALHRKQPSNWRATARLALLNLDRGDLEEARRLHGTIGPEHTNEPTVRLVAARLTFAQVLSKAPAPGEVSAAAERGDWESLYTLAAYDVVSGHYEEAGNHFLELLRQNRDWGQGKARQALLDLLQIVGPDTALAAKLRRRMAQYLH